MVGVRIRLAVRMAVDTGESRVIRRIDMAGGAGRPHSGVRAGVNREPGVIESGPRPRSCVVAQRAVGGEGCCHVVGIGGALVILLVAGIAGCRRSYELIINVATGAGHGGVRAGQGEAGQVVVKAGRHPRRGGMAHLALLREAGGRVIGIVGVLEILQVARNAQRAEVGELPADVAGLALQCGMRAGEGETAQRVVELRIRPGDGAVANGAVRGESAGHVIRIVSFLKIRHVAGRAGGRHRRVAAVDMALRARHFRVRPAQQPSCHGMVEIHVHP